MPLGSTDDDQHVAIRLSARFEPPVTSWLQELETLSERPNLGGPARTAVARALDAFEDEDGALPLPAARIRRALDSGGEPARDTSADRAGRARPARTRNVVEAAWQLGRALVVPQTHEPPVTHARVSAPGQSVRLHAPRLRPHTPC
jgi:hypothetical protein